MSRLSIGRTYKTHRDNQLRGILAIGDQQDEAWGIGSQQLEALKLAEGKGRVSGLYFADIYQQLARIFSGWL